MRALFFLLLVVNLAVAGYAFLAPRRSSPDAELLVQQMNADRVRIVPPRPAPVAPRKVVCMEWGNVPESEMPPARAALEQLQLGERLTVLDIAPTPGWWVFIPPLNNRAEVEKKITELESLGVKEYYTIEAAGPMRNAVSLGMFSTEEGANNFLAGLRAKGVRSARVAEREHRRAFVVREPDAQTAARLGEIKSSFPGTELKTLDCPTASPASR